MLYNIKLFQKYINTYNFLSVNNNIIFSRYDDCFLERKSLLLFRKTQNFDTGLSIISEA